jgi:protein-S-isoprenylcysteine O-methyltransferase Ste14
MNLASFLAFLFLAASLGMLLLRGGLLAAGPIGMAIQVLAVVLMIWARVTFGIRSFHATARPTAGGLVTTGPYRFIRHPIYAAVLYFTWVGVFSHTSTLNVMLGLLATAGTIIRMATEERLLVQRYPAYLDYAARTRRVIPFVV